MTRINSSSVYTERLKQWIDEGIEISAIKEKLTLEGLDEAAIENCIREFKKMKYGRRQTIGFILLAIGAFLGFFSFVLTITNPVPGLYGFFLYGLSSLAIVVIFIGLICLVG